LPARVSGAFCVCTGVGPQDGVTTGRGLWRAPARMAAVVVGLVLPMLPTAMAHATLPGGVDPPVPVPASGQPITIVVEPPSLYTVTVPTPPDNCAIDMSYDNTQANPAGSLYRGETACGSDVYAPGMSGTTTLTDIFGTVVSRGRGFGARGNGPFTSQGDYVVGTGSGVVTAGLSGTGPVPGMDYTINYTTSITLVWPQYWGPAPAGCTVSGQTMRCVASTTYSYLPGTQGGFRPS
jgi:hypothetical protein